MPRKSIIGLTLVLCAAYGTWWHQSRQSPAISMNKVNGTLPTAENSKWHPPISPAVRSAPEDERRPIVWSTVEGRLIKGNAVDVNAQQAFLLSDKRQFDRAMDALETEMMSNSSAQELGEDYRQLLLARMQMEGRAGLSLDRFACSERVCIGQFSGNDAAWSAFDVSMSSASAEEFPALTRSYYSHQDRVTGNVDHRMFFTTSPQINAFQSRLPGGMP